MAIKIPSHLRTLNKDEINDLLRFTGVFFDEKMQSDLSNYIENGINKSDVKISLRERTIFANPALTGMMRGMGVYNPEQIPYTTFDLMKNDPQVSAGLAFIKMPITSLSWRIECDNEKISAFVEFALKKVWRKLIRSLLTAVDYGFASHEKVFEIQNAKVTKKSKAGTKKIFFDGPAVLYKKFKPHHPYSISMLFDGKENFNGIEQNANGKYIRVKKNKCFLFTHDMEFGNYFGKSRLVPAYKFWYWKEVLYQFMLMYYERRGSPPIIVTAPPGQSLNSSDSRVNNLDLALDIGSSLLSNSIAALPYEKSKDGGENMWSLNYLSDDKRGEMFIQAINHLDAAILRAMWIPEKVLTNESGNGSYSLASIHADLFLISELGLVNDIEAAIDEQVIPLLVQANFKPEEIEPCYFKMESLDWNRKIALKEIFIEMMRNVDNMVQLGLRPRVMPSLEQMAKILDIPIDSFKAEVNGEVTIPSDGTGYDNSNKSDLQIPVTKKAIPPEENVKSTVPPPRQKRSSFTGTTQVEQKVLRPGSRQAEKMRSKLSDKNVSDNFNEKDVLLNLIKLTYNDEAIYEIINIFNSLSDKKIRKYKNKSKLTNEIIKMNDYELEVLSEIACF